MSNESRTWIVKSLEVEEKDRVESAYMVMEKEVLRRPLLEVGTKIGLRF